MKRGPTGSDNFLSLLPKQFSKGANASIADLTRQPIRTPSALRSYVVETSEAAWSTAMNKLSCEHVRMLVSQKMGLAHVGLMAAEFTVLYPKAEIAFYPGDFSLGALRAVPELMVVAPSAVARLKQADFSWMHSSFDFARDLQRESELLFAKLQAAKI